MKNYVNDKTADHKMAAESLLPRVPDVGINAQPP